MITSFGLFFAGGDGGNRSCASSAASQPSHLYVPFAVAKDGLCGFDYLKKTNPNRKIGSGSSWWRWRKPKLRFVRCFAAFAFICPFCCRKRWTVRFRLPKKKRTQTEKSVQVRHGGDGGNRNRVRKPLLYAFYERRRSFKLPPSVRRSSGSPLRYPLIHDGLQGYSSVHVHR